MDPLAAPDDVALALGLDDASALSDSQGNRVDGLLARVSRTFRREAERPFSPGTDTLRLLSVGGRVRTPEPITAVASVTMVSCGETVNVDHTVDGQWVVCEYRNRPVPSGVVVTVTYTHSAEVSDDVVAEVAGIVARHLTVDPTSAEAQSVRLATDSFSQQFADWVSDTGLLTESECEMARSYRYPGSTVVIQRP